MVDFSALSNAGWFQLPQPFAFGVKFDISAIIPLAILFLVNSIQAMGDFSATTSGGMDRLPTDQELNGGIIGYGISNIVSACFGCPPTATYSQNVGIVTTTKVINAGFWDLQLHSLALPDLCEVSVTSDNHSAVRAGRCNSIRFCIHCHDRYETGGFR